MFKQTNLSSENKVLLQTVGRRKSARAQVKISFGCGKIFINTQEANNYFQQNLALLIFIQKSIDLLQINKKYNFYITVRGGGLVGQANAIALGIARAVSSVEFLQKTILKENGVLTRDARCKERKKYGLKKARKAPQFSKR